MSNFASPLSVIDLSFLTRAGVKGAGAAAWLQQQGVERVDRADLGSLLPNCWASLVGGGLVARLGLSEFLVEDSLESRIAPRLAAGQDFPAKVYPVLRQDLAIALYGERVHELLLQTCSVNFRALSLAERPVVLTSMMGVAVTVIPGERDELPFYRLWCDSTFGVYFWETLLEIAQELGGRTVKLADLESQPFMKNSIGEV